MSEKAMITSNYTLHLNLLAQEEKSRMFNVPPFWLLLGLAAFTHIALMSPLLFLRAAETLPKSKQVRLAFGVDKEITKQAMMAEEKAEIAPPITPKAEPTPPKRRQPPETKVAAPTPAPSVARIGHDIPKPRVAPSNVMLRPSNAKLANLRNSSGGYKTNIAASSGEVVGRYEQLLSGWINSHRLNKMLTLPAETNGRVVVRIRINRRGYVIFKAIEQSSGDAGLDKAAIESVTRASPVPAVPAEYPGGGQLEFLIPISFVVN